MRWFCEGSESVSVQRVRMVSEGGGVNGRGFGIEQVCCQLVEYIERSQENKLFQKVIYLLLCG